jgi:hypothetical protein
MGNRVADLATLFFVLTADLRNHPHQVARDGPDRALVDCAVGDFDFAFELMAPRHNARLDEHAGERCRRRGDDRAFDLAQPGCKRCVLAFGGDQSRVLAPRIARGVSMIIRAHDLLGPIWGFGREALVSIA